MDETIVATGETLVPETQTTPPTTEPTTQTDPPKTFGEDDVKKIVEEHFTNYETQKAKEKETKKTEAEKLAGMTAEQKAEYEIQKRLAEIDARNIEVTKKELRIEAHKTLTDKGLPVELLDVLIYSDAEGCNKSIEAVETAFRSAVEKAVNQRLQGETPKKATSTSTLTIEQIRNMTQEEIMANFEEVEKVLANQTNY